MLWYLMKRNGIMKEGACKDELVNSLVTFGCHKTWCTGKPLWRRNFAFVNQLDNCEPLKEYYLEVTVVGKGCFK